MVRPCSRLSARKLARGAEDEEHAMPEKLDTSIAVIGIDIGKNSFHVVGHDLWVNRVVSGRSQAARHVRFARRVQPIDATPSNLA
jgi:hypothetical protein